MRKAFSLIEVVVAIGIVAFALVSIISLMSLGLQSSKDSTDDTNVALMTQTVISDLRTLGYSNVTSITGASSSSPPNTTLAFFFDASGAPSHDGAGNVIWSGTASTTGTNNVGSAVPVPVYMCTVTNKTPSPSAQPVPFPPNFIWLRLDFSWPFVAPAANQQHKYVYTSLAQYN